MPVQAQRDANDNVTALPVQRADKPQPSIISAAAAAQHTERRIGDSVSTQPVRRHGSGSSAQPMITLTDMTAAGLHHRRDQILYSDDFDAIHDYLLNTDSPMLALSPSWLCTGTDHTETSVFNQPVCTMSLGHPVMSTDHPQMSRDGSVFPPAISHAIKPITSVTSAVTQPTAMTSHSSTIDMSSSIESSAVHDRKVCVHVFVAALISVCFTDFISLCSLCTSIRSGYCRRVVVATTH